MSYTPRPNASGDTLVDSRDPIRNNFVTIQDRFDENHVAINGAAGGGKHKFLQMPDQASAPATAANEGGLYVKSDAGGASQLFYRNESNGSELQLTPIYPIRAAVNFDGTVAGNNAVQTIRGTAFNVTSVTRNGTATGQYNITFTTALPSTNYIVLATGQRSGIGSGYVYGAIRDEAYATAVQTTVLHIDFSSQGSNRHNVNMGNIVIFGG